MFFNIRFAVIAAVLLLSACGGGGGGGNGTSISINPNSLTFQAVQGDPAPAGKTVDVSYAGDGVLVGFPPDVPQPSWLNVTTTSSTSGHASFLVTVSPPDFPPQTFTTTLRFVTGHTDGTDITYVDMQVAYQIGSDPLMISAQPTQLDFSAAANGATPAAQSLTVTFTGSQSQVDQTTLPSWLTVTPASSSSSPQAYSVVPNTTSFSAGTQLSATINFITTATGHSYTQSVAVPVSYTLYQGFGATAPTMNFTGVDSQAATQPSAGYVVNIVGDHAQWSASADQSWVKLSAASGSGPGAIMVTANAGGLGSGTYSASLKITDSASAKTQSLPVSLVMHAARLTASPSTPSISIGSTTPASGLKASVTLSDELNGAVPAQAVHWSVASIDVPWLKWSPASGTSSPSVQATVSVDPTQLASLAAGTYGGTVTLNYTSADSTTGTLKFPVGLNLQLPLVQTVSYYVATASTAGNVKLRGQNFDLAGNNPVLFGSNAATTTVIDDSTQATVSYGKLAAGKYTVQFQNAAGIPRGTAQLLVLAPQTMSYQVINVAGSRSHLIYDAERAALYAVNQQSQELEVYRYSGGSWSADSPLVALNLEDAALSPDGKKLVATSDASMLEIDLTKRPLQAVHTAANPDSFCAEYLDHLAMGNDGRYLVVPSYKECSGSAEAYIYDSQSQTLTQAATYPNGDFYEPYLGGAADGSRVYISETGLSPTQPMWIYNSLGDYLSQSSTDNEVYTISVSRDASRVILGQTAVYDTNLTQLGNIPTGGASVVSPDATRAYAYSNANGPTLEVYDLTAPLGSGANYPLLKSVPLANDPGSAYVYGVQLAVSSDGKTLFISGTDSILVVPLP